MEKKSKKIQKRNKGFTLIELMVAMFIFMMVMVAMVAVSIAGFRSYSKSKAIKTVTEDVGFAINSITKDVRMGKIESAYANGGEGNFLLVTRNANQTKVCYKITNSNKQLILVDKSKNDCTADTGGAEKILVDLGTDMDFDATSGFRSCVTDNKGDGTVTACNGVSNEKRRGWAEINLNIEDPTMDTDSIHVQTIVSSRDYGWESVP